MGKTEYGTLYPFDIQPVGNGEWEVVNHQTSERTRRPDYDRAITLALAMRKEYEERNRNVR